MAGEILVVNAGSTSLKLSAVDEHDRARRVERLGDAPPGVVAVAHRVVHGGDRFRRPVVVDEAVERAIDELSELAPLHNTPAVRAMREARRLLPDVPHVAVFDTAFHATMAPEASTYALPRELRDEFGIRRYGFHGLSVQWSSEQVRVPRLVVCHLGGGCSVTAVRDGRSVDTSMGFSPLEGVPMATRSGSVDPGAVLHLLRVRRLTMEQLARLLEHHSGLAGLSGISGSVETLQSSTSPAAQFALSVYAYRIAATVASMAAALGGLDAIVFTAGVGEHSALVRADVCSRLAFLGVELDAAANAGAAAGDDIGLPGSRVRIVIVEAREDIVAAREARSVLAAQPVSEPWNVSQALGLPDS